MSRVVVLDSGPLGLLAHTRNVLPSVECRNWLKGLLRSNVTVWLPEIADYEVRRELLRLGNGLAIRRLDGYCEELHYLAISTPAMKLAAELWAKSRREGRPRADPHALDGDVILAAQVITAAAPGAVVATTNVSHLAPLVDARRWNDITA